MAIYIGTTGGEPDKAIPGALGACFGPYRPDRDNDADEDTLTSLTLQTDAAHRDDIPYCNRPIPRHTTMTTTPSGRQIYGSLLDCVQPAKTGGENARLDHEIGYIPSAVRTTSAPSCIQPV